MKRFISYILLVVGLFAFTSSGKLTTIFIIGDSTAADKQNPQTNPERGWGMVLQGYFDRHVRISNHAVNGRSSKSFIDEGRWQRVLDKLKPGDYVFIQFGHNDEKPQPERHTEPGSTFDDNLRKFVSETRSKGAIPVLFNSVVRRNFAVQAPRNDDDEALRKQSFSAQSSEEGEVLVDTHGEYAKVPQRIAQEMGVAFVDANRITHDLEQGLGSKASRHLHMWFYPGDPRVPAGRQDNTHYNVQGAHTVAALMAEAVGKAVPALKPYIRHYDLTVATNGSAVYFSPQDAVDAAPAGKTSTVMIGAGEWQRPVVPHYKKVKFIMREGARWK